MDLQNKRSPTHDAQESHLAAEALEKEKQHACEQAGLKGEDLPDYASDSIALASAYLSGLKERYTELYIGKYEENMDIAGHELDATRQHISEMEDHCERLGGHQIATHAATVAEAQPQPHHDDPGKDLATPEAGLSELSEALGQSLGTAQDPVNKALRGIADHVSGKLDGGDSFYRRMGLQNPAKHQGAQHEYSHEGPALDMS